MKIRITEPVFFLGSPRQPDDILDNVTVGPYRTQVIPGGLSRTAQFVEMPEEIKQVLQVAAADVGNMSDVGTAQNAMTQPVVRRPQVEVLPPIQIKGLAADVMTVKRGFADIREVVRDVNLVSVALKQDLQDVKAQLQQHRQDIRFEAEALGNG